MLNNSDDNRKTSDDDNDNVDWTLSHRSLNALPFKTNATLLSSVCYCLDLVCNVFLGGQERFENQNLRVYHRICAQINGKRNTQFPFCFCSVKCSIHIVYAWTIRDLIRLIHSDHFQNVMQNFMQSLLVFTMKSQSSVGDLKIQIIQWFHVCQTIFPSPSECIVYECVCVWFGSLARKAEIKWTNKQFQLSY